MENISDLPLTLGLCSSIWRIPDHLWVLALLFRGKCNDQQESVGAPPPCRKKEIPVLPFSLGGKGYVIYLHHLPYKIPKRSKILRLLTLNHNQ